MELSKYIKEILIDRDSIVIPNLGSFEKKTIPASINNETGDMRPPRPDIVFNSQNKAGNGWLYKSIAEKTKISEKEVIEKVNSEVQLLNKTLDAGKTVNLNGLGTLKKEKNGQIIFKADINALDLPDFYGLATINVATKDSAKTSVTNTKQENKKKPAAKNTKAKKKTTPQRKQPKPKVKKQVVKTEEQKKKDKKRLLLLLLLIPLIALIVLGIWKFDYVKQITNSVVEYFTNDNKKDDKTQKDTVKIVETPVIDTVKDDNNADTEAILENYTIIDSKTNDKIKPKVEEFSNAKKIHIIAGSFARKRNAKDERNKLIKKGFKDAQVLPLNNNLYRVSIASFDKVEDAVQDFERIKSLDNSLDVWILRVNQ